MDRKVWTMSSVPCTLKVEIKIQTSEWRVVHTARDQWNSVVNYLPIPLVISLRHEMINVILLHDIPPFPCGNQLYCYTSFPATSGADAQVSDNLWASVSPHRLRALQSRGVRDWLLTTTLGKMAKRSLKTARVYVRRVEHRSDTPGQKERQLGLEPRYHSKAIPLSQIHSRMC